MKSVAAFALLLVCAGTFPACAAVTNLNTTSNLSDQGIEPLAGLRLVTPNILDGIPLMQGLQLVEDKTVDILPGDNAPQPVVAIGILDIDDIYNFYKIALPDLGWKTAGPRDYMRNGETLHINAQAAPDGKSSIVTFTEKKDTP